MTDIVERLEAHMGKADIGDVLPDCREAARIIKDLRAQVERVRSALAELHAVVRGECPSLLNEDSGGDAKLAIEIEAILAEGK